MKNKRDETQDTAKLHTQTKAKVSKRKQAEEAIKESEQKYRLLFDEMLSGFAVHEIICDQTGKPVDYRFLSVNAAFEKMTGLNSADILDRTVMEVMPNTEPIWVERYGRVALTREPIQFDNYSSVLDKYFEVRAFSPEPGKFATVINDVTEYKQSEKLKRESEERYRTVINTANDAIISSDNAGCIIGWNRGAELIFGYSEMEAIGSPLTMLMPPNLRDTHNINFMRLQHGGEKHIVGKTIEMSGRRKDGGEFPLEISLTEWLFNDDQFFTAIMRDITVRKQAESEVQQRERFLALLNDMTHSIITAQNFDTMMQILVNNLTTLLKADSCYITRWDPIKEQVFPVATNAKADHPFLTTQYPKGEKNLTSSALEIGHVLIVEDVLNTELSSPYIIQRFSEKSIISIPLIYGEHKLGAAIVGFQESHQFIQAEIEHAQQASNQIALAIWNAQQDFELEKRLQEVETLARISQALSETEKIGLQTVLQLIVTSAKELIPGAEQAVIHLLDEEQLLSAQAVTGYKDNTTAGWKLIKIRPNEGVAGQVLVSGQAINIADVEKDPRFVTYAGPPKYKSLMVAPVQSGEKKLGTISVQSVSVNAFTEAESRLLSALGTQAAIAIENAHLLESIQQALKESNALYRINQELVSSLDPQELLKDVVDLLQKNFGYYHVQIYILDSETGDFVMREGSGEIGRQLKEQGHRLHAGEGIVGYTAETKAAFFTNDVDKMLSFVRIPLLPDIKSELAVPVKIDDQILGLLDIQQVPPAYLSQNDLRLVSAVADQLSIALQKANLYSDLQAALQVETAIRNQMVQSERLVTMGRLLASVSHELNNPLQAIQNALFLLREEKGVSLQGKLDLDIVLSEAERMSALIERLRTTYRPIQPEDFQPTQINNIVEDVCALISTHLRHNEIIFEFHPEPDLPLIPALSDQIRQVVINLLMNAVEAMTTGGKLMVCTQLLGDTNEILLTVSDTGVGIPSELLPSIFDAFITNKQNGTGLGLTITYDIVMKHSGRISAENNPDKGSIFKVWLPITNMEIE